MQPVARALPLPSSADRGDPTMRLALQEAVVFALMLGLTDAFLLADAVRLGATALEIGLVVSLPLFIGAAGPTLALRALDRGATTRRLAIAGALVQASALATGSIVELAGRMIPAGLIALACVYQLGGQLAVTATSAWLGDVVPSDTRIRFFASRARRVYLGTVAGLVVGGFALERLGEASGFGVVFGLAALARARSAQLQHRAPPAPPWSPPSRPDTTSSDPRQLRLLAGAAFALHLAVFLAAPFFTPHMLGPLGLSYGELTVATLAIGLGSAAALPAWSRAIERWGARRVYAASLVLISLVPLPWLAIRSVPGVVAVQAFSGISWAAYEVGLLSLLLQLTDPGSRPRALAAVAVGTGLGQLVGGLAATAIVHHLGFQAALTATSLLRTAVALAAIAALARLTGMVTHQAPAFRIAGFRPHAGLVHRLVEPARSTATHTSARKAS